MKHASLSLYRKEAIEGQRDAWLGRPRLIQPVSVLVATNLSIACLALIGNLLYFGEYTRRVHVPGTVVPSAGVSHVFAPQGGHIISNAVKEGSTVHQGDTLFTIGLDSKTKAGETGVVVREQLVKRQQQIDETIEHRIALSHIEKAGLIDQEQKVQAEIQHVDMQLKHSTEYVGILEKSKLLYRQLVDRGITVQREYDIREQSYMQTRQEMESLGRLRVQLDEKLSELRTKITSSDATAAIGIIELRQRVAAIEQELAQGEARVAVDVVAARDGVVAALLAQSGQMVVTGAPLLTLIPAETKMEIHLMAQTNAVGFVREGARVLIRYSAFPYQKFGQYPGVVQNVSRTTLRQGDSDYTATATPNQRPDTPLYRITIVPDQPFVMAYGKPEMLRAGMTVETDIMLDTRRLYQWFFEPLYSLRGNLMTPLSKDKL